MNTNMYFRYTVFPRQKFEQVGSALSQAASDATWVSQLRSDPRTDSKSMMDAMAQAQSSMMNSIFQMAKATHLVEDAHIDTVDGSNVNRIA